MFILDYTIRVLSIKVSAICTSFAINHYTNVRMFLFRVFRYCINMALEDQQCSLSTHAAEFQRFRRIGGSSPFGWSIFLAAFFGHRSSCTEVRLRRASAKRVDNSRHIGEHTTCARPCAERARGERQNWRNPGEALKHKASAATEHQVQGCRLACRYVSNAVLRGASHDWKKLYACLYLCLC